MANEKTTIEIGAVDRTAAAFASVQKNLERIDAPLMRINNILGVVAGGAVAGFAAAIVKAGEEGQESMRRLEAVLKATGNQSGFTAQQLDQVADSMARVTKFDDESIRDATATILKFGNIAGDQLTRVLKLSTDYAAFNKTDMSSAAEALGKALASPAQGMERLQRQVGYLTQSEKDLIRELEESGDRIGAQTKLLEILEGKIGGAADAMNKGFTRAVGDAKKALNELFELIGKQGDDAFSVKALDTLSSAMRGIKQLVEEGHFLERFIALTLAAQGNPVAAALLLGKNVADADVRAGGKPLPTADPLAAGLAQERAQREADRAALKKLDEELARHNKWWTEEQKKANAERQRDAYETAQRIQKGEEESAQESAEAWQYWDKYVLEEERKLVAERLALGEAYVKQQEFDAEQTTEAWLYYNKFVLDQEKKRKEESEKTWGGFLSGIESAFRDTFDRIYEGQINSFADFAQALADIFKRIFLDFVYQALAKPFVLQLVASGAGAMGMSGLANAATGQLGSLAAGGGFAATGAEFVQGAMGTFVGPAAPGSAAALGGEFAAFMTNPATIAVLAAVAVIVAARNRAGGPKEGGSYFGAYDAAGRFTGDLTVPGSDNGRFFTPAGGDSTMRAFGDKLAEGFFSTLRRLGGTTGGIDFGFGFDKDPQGRAASRVSSLVRDSAGNVVYSNTASAGRDDADFDRALGLEAKRAMLAALQASDLPEAIAALLAPVDAISAAADDIDKALAAAEAMAQVISALAELNIPGLDVAALQGFQRDGEELAATLQRVGGLWGQYAQLFTTDAERLAQAQGQITATFAGLGVAVPDSMEAFKALVDGLDLTSETGRAAWEALMEVAPAFAAVANAAQDAADKAAAAASTMLASFDAVMGQLRGSPYTRTIQQQQLDTALGQFRGANAWSQGLSLDGLMGQILTITREDFRNYSADMQGLITQILTLYQSLNSLADPVSTITATVAPAIDTTADAAAHLTTKLDLLAQIYALNGDAVSAAAIKEHQRALALEEIRRQDAAAGTIGELEGLTTTLWQLQDAAAAAAEAAALESRRADLRLQILEMTEGPEAALAVRRENELKGVDDLTAGLMRQVWAMEDADRAAKKVVEAMKETAAAMEEVARFRDTVSGAILSIRSTQPGFDMVGYQAGQVGAARAALAGADSLEARLAAGEKLRDAIMGRYQAELDAANAAHQAQEEAARAAIDAANQLNQAFRNIGDYARSLLLGPDSPLTAQQRLATAGDQYRTLLARARGGDLAALGQLQGAATDYLGQARSSYASSGAYVGIFGEVQTALEQLGARAGPDQVYAENTAAWQSSLLDIQTRAITELEGLQTLTDGWTAELQDTLDEQGIAFANIDLSTAQIAENTRNLPERVGTVIEGAIEVQRQTTKALAEAVAAAQRTAGGDTVAAINALPAAIAAATAATARR